MLTTQPNKDNVLQIKHYICLFSVISLLNAAWAFHALGTPLGVPIVWSPYRITLIHWLVARKPALTYSRPHLILANAPSAPQISLPSRSGHTSPSVAIFLAQSSIIRGFLHFHFGDCISGTLFSSRWSAMEYRRCQPPCARFITSDDPQ